jgi:hypothetical protein
MEQSSLPSSTADSVLTAQDAMAGDNYISAMPTMSLSANGSVHPTRQSTVMDPNLEEDGVSQSITAGSLRICKKFVLY